MVPSFSFMGSLISSRKHWNFIRSGRANFYLYDFKGIAGSVAEIKLFSSMTAVIFFSVSVENGCRIFQ